MSEQDICHKYGYPVVVFSEEDIKLYLEKDGDGRYKSALTPYMKQIRRDLCKLLKGNHKRDYYEIQKLKKIICRSYQR